MLKFLFEKIAYWKKHPSIRVFEYDVVAEQRFFDDEVIVRGKYRAVWDHAPDNPDLNYHSLVGSCYQEVDGQWYAMLKDVDDDYVGPFDSAETAQLHIRSLFALEDLQQGFIDVPIP